MRISLKKWAENEFKTDQEFNLIPSLYSKLKNEGADFNDSLPTVKSQQASVSKDPSGVSTQQEEDDLARAIELSLKDRNDLVKLIFFIKKRTNNDFFHYNHSHLRFILI